MNTLKKVYRKEDFKVGELVKVTKSNWRGEKCVIKEITEHGLILDGTRIAVSYECIKKVPQQP